MLFHLLLIWPRDLLRDEYADTYSPAKGHDTFSVLLAISDRVNGRLSNLVGWEAPVDPNISTNLWEHS